VEFLGIGYQEVLLVFVLLLVVVGPQRMPEVAYQIGKAVREMQKYARAVRDEFSEEWEYLDSQAKEIRGEMDSATRDMQEMQRSLRSETQALDKELKSATADVEKALPAAKPANGKTASAPTSTLSTAARKPATFPSAANGRGSVTGDSTTTDRLRALAKPTESTDATPPGQPETESKDGEASEGGKPAGKSSKPPLVF
jgi:sec-independent protein translocase protein TatB